MRNCLVVVALLSALLTLGCKSEISSEECRLEPDQCNGGAGALCEEDRDCAPELNCCTDNGNCGTGMCTASCEVDEDCPMDMRCEHDMCFYACESDEDCAEGMSCEHGNTVCEWD